jgi:hypothetical protein
MSNFQYSMSYIIITFGLWKVLDKAKLQNYYKKN